MMTTKINKNFREFLNDNLGLTFDKQVQVARDIVSLITRGLCAAIYCIYCLVIAAAIGIKKACVFTVKAVKGSYTIKGMALIAKVVAPIIAAVALFFVIMYFAFVKPYDYDGDYEMRTYTVVSGDTLWSIAAEYAPELHMPKEVFIDIIEKNNDLGRYIYPGQKIQIPREVMISADVKN